MDLSRRTKDHRSAKRNGHAFDHAVLVVSFLGKMPQHIACGSLADLIRWSSGGELSFTKCVSARFGQ